MKRFIFVIFLCILCVNCYNVNVKNVYIYSKPKINVSDRSSYFGYSVILTKNWVQIGAPRANSSRFGDSVMEPGVAYRCKILSPCKEMDLDYIGNEQRYSIRSVIDLKNYSWIGGSMDMEAREDGKVVVCGHRWKNQFNADSSHSYAISGICYESESNRFKILLPEEFYTNHLYYAYTGELLDSQFGMSLSIARPSREKISLLIGAPGAGPFWTGGGVQYESEQMKSAIARRRRAVTNQNFGNFEKLGFINKNTYNNLKQFSLFGYQVSSGFFFNPYTLNYVTSSPRGADLKGYVLIYNVYYRTTYAYPSVEELDVKQGYTTGEYFGSSLAVADVNGDGLDELIVGSPLFSLRGDEGRIYVFSRHAGNKLYNIDKKTGFKVGGRFGSSLASLGDIDQDSFEDIAVGSPYEENGVIYIYNGGVKGLSQKYSQRIKASDIHSTLSGFGISISKSNDIDGNKYNDFVVGSYLSGHVVLFRTHPTVELVTQLSSVKKLNLSDTQFFVKACIKYVGLNAPKGVEIVRNIDIDIDFHRFEQIPPKNLTLKNNDSFECEDLLIKKMKHDESRIDIVEDVKITLFQQINYAEHPEMNIVWIKDTAESEGEDKFCANCPVLRKSHSSFLVIPYSRDCGGGDCISDVKLQCELTQDNSSTENINSYVIGSKPIIKLVVNISNFGHTLYSGGIKLNIPKEVNLAQIPYACQESYVDSLLVTCKLGAIVNGAVKHINISLDLSAFEKLRSLSENGECLSLNVSTYLLGNHIDKDTSNNICNLKLNLIMDADILIYGKSEKEIYTYENVEKDVKESRDNTRIGHTIEVSNIGISPLREVQIMLYVPIVWQNYGSDIEFVVPSVEAYQNTKSVSCLFHDTKENVQEIHTNEEIHNMLLAGAKTENISSIDNDSNPLNRTLFLNCSSRHIKCKQFVCNFMEFTSDTHVKLVVGATLNISLLEPFMGQKDILYFSTYGFVKTANTSNENLKYAIVSSTIIGSVPNEEVELWIIIICIIAGILLIALVVMGLMKAGFFRREKREELQALKLSDQRD